MNIVKSLRTLWCVRLHRRTVCYGGRVVLNVSGKRFKYCLEKKKSQREKSLEHLRVGQILMDKFMLYFWHISSFQCVWRSRRKLLALSSTVKFINMGNSLHPLKSSYCHCGEGMQNCDSLDEQCRALLPKEGSWSSARSVCQTATPYSWSRSQARERRCRPKAEACCWFPAIATPLGNPKPGIDWSSFGSLIYFKGRAQHHILHLLPANH